MLVHLVVLGWNEPLWSLHESTGEARRRVAKTVRQPLGFSQAY